MVEIKVLLFGSKMFIPCCNHIEAILTDQTTGRIKEIAFPYSEVLTDNDINKNCCLDVVTLYSNQSLDSFEDAYRHHFDLSAYHCLNHNCASSVDFMLSYFFPDACPEKFLSTFFRILCCPISMATCCLLSCVPIPPPITSPVDIFRKAQLLKCRFGALPENLIANENQDETTYLFR